MAIKTIEIPRGGQLTHRRLGRVKLRVRSGPDRGREIEVPRTTITGGRSEVNDLVLTDGSVSTTHFELVLRDGGVLLRDRDSTNGTWIGNARVVEAWIDVGAVFSPGQHTEVELLSAEEVDVPISPHDRFEEMYGASSGMREVFSVLERAANASLDVLLAGETGTGKELAARALHGRSPRAKGPFVVLDCAALPRELAEATILGYKKGAFTGAHEDNAGCFEEAHGGTLFMDEIGELPLELQPKLLRVLDRREVQRIGEVKPRPVDVRLVAATHRDLRQMVGEGKFRADLYYRLDELTVTLPALRERGSDMLLLADRFLQGFARDRGVALSFSDEAYQALRAHPWPGNVRELKKVIKRAAMLCPGSTVRRDDLVLGGAVANDALDESIYRLPLDEARTEFEREYFKRLLERTRGNVSEAARQTGYTRQGLRDLLKRIGLS
ncbi:sigma 54-interacting transcriptional regulator [Paraliomyxa miuraensis]|uniref:sigma 54-interacting transcriptional regulator n=1 Tax=Paraliomyxa miuraensis TaxID=376150 RepID=UPI002252387C|nr:sigma 54-interacting transcriptional regulator [Paraliomyxa miuraensis]MCX4246018.1 sigma 54-interacting transcriptional regulator [Paraliomyxa miuraensis]